LAELETCRKDGGRKPPFTNIDDHHTQCEPKTLRSQRVGTARVAAAKVANVDAAAQLADDQASEQRADQVCDENFCDEVEQA